MNTITPEPLDRITAELIRRGLPPDYALRAAAELEDHRRDLVEELQAAGHSDAQALAEASQRLGDERTLVKKMVREYQCRYWCGRWPLVSFFLAPIPAVFCAWFVAGLVSMRLYEVLIHVGQWLGMTEIAPATIAVLKLIFLGGATAALAPLILTFLFYRLARRSGCGTRWALVSIWQVAFLASLLNFNLDCEKGILFFEPAMLRGVFFASTFSEFLQSYFVQPTQALQFAAPLAALGVLVWHERRKQGILDPPAASPIA